MGSNETRCSSASCGHIAAASGSVKVVSDDQLLSELSELSRLFMRAIEPRMPRNAFVQNDDLVRTAER